MRRVLVPLAALGLVLITGCGDQEAGASGDGAAAPAGAVTPGDSEAQQQKLENLIADCMKKQGFQYVPRAVEAAAPDTTRFTGPLSVLTPPDEVREFRQKYGFGVFGRLAYPNDPLMARPKANTGDNPNNAIREGLDPARREAYDLALNGVDTMYKAGDKKTAPAGPKGCGTEASLAVYGEGRDEATEQAQQRAYAAFQAEPEVVAAAQKYADCLRAQGFKIESARPGEVEDNVNSAALNGALPAGDAGGAKVPQSDAVTAAVGGQKPLNTEAARAGLQVEIKAALADLDCRTDYATLVRAKYAKVLADGNGVG